VLAFPRGLAGLVTDQILPWLASLRGKGRDHGRSGATPAAQPAPAE